ncbi:hypothetical protein Xmir_00006 [Xenorhabdus miraniensis]|uniref:Uncharacterized protein n=1 Tax=Xenorhabdus miraniensis TaxID=351674 RepID=A0A2D0JW50_9GAMM|nr:hypothetical protein Xmir_00006 [Xenorhabdus miraniensis]
MDCSSGREPIRTPFDRIKAEGRTLELISHWLLPLGQSISITSKNHSDTCCYQILSQRNWVRDIKVG